ncbi:MAG: ATP-binding protein [Prolixibacteraceae bacterium]|jgi:AAA+ superfamily predicted ATPase|nr:ATP-binding protein [Prolixibacteraceae bacterium]MBT6007430.1 ATP-binding protein [Prolixibacteraceae bacterium]MBT6764394.1 ATP-binding protein [Prolixibacteraceae bacterium]MBT7038914.1 ATP-binding protein [Bacteroidota bacterium]MBT7393552.1 ATP-binding protein [Prolixibacteraceae bacterium]
MIGNDILKYLSKILEWRLSGEFEKHRNIFPLLEITDNNSKLIQFISKNNLSEAETITLFLALIPHIVPDFFNKIIEKYYPNGGEFPEFGGTKGKNHRGILPTGETVLYVLAGKDIEKRLEISNVFEEDHLFAKKNVLCLEQTETGEPKMSGRLILDDEYVDLFTIEKISRPKLTSDFPAQLINTELEWKDLVLQQKTLSGIKEIETWLKYNEKLMNDWEMRGKIKPGYRILFHGPPGTGKTMTACLLGKYTKRDVFRIDLSMVVSKYIGETEKNLSKLFNKAANKDWILFFDEADSIFGKRTNVRDAHDKYANQEVSYLLQRIEAHAGLVILASNMKANIDTSFTRRFNSIIEFENPGTSERLKLWENYIPENIKTDDKISIKEIAHKYDITGANIVNVIQYAGLKTLEKKSKTIAFEDLMKGIQKEYVKEGKMMGRR